MKSFLDKADFGNFTNDRTKIKIGNVTHIREDNHLAIRKSAVNKWILTKSVLFIQMKTKVEKLVKKILLFFGVVSFKSKPDSHLSLAKVHTSSILLGGLNIRFDNGWDEKFYVNIGERCIIKSSFIFESRQGIIKIGNNVHIGGAMMISRSSITIKDDVTMAWDITIYDHDSHSIFWNERQNDNHQCYNDYKDCNGNNVKNKDWSTVVSKPILIESKVWIGFGVTILKGVTIGEGAVIGAKSVVTKNVPAWTVAAGNPAVVVKHLKV